MSTKGQGGPRRTPGAYQVFISQLRSSSGISRTLLLRTAIASDVNGSQLLALSYGLCGFSCGQSLGGLLTPFGRKSRLKGKGTSASKFRTPELPAGGTQRGSFQPSSGGLNFVFPGWVPFLRRLAVHIWPGRVGSGRGGPSCHSQGAVFLTSQTFPFRSRLMVGVQPLGNLQSFSRASLATSYLPTSDGFSGSSRLQCYPDVDAAR